MGVRGAFEGLRARRLACLDLAEAERLRQLDWRGPILLLEGAFEPRDLELCSRLKSPMSCTARPRSTGWPCTRRTSPTAFTSSSTRA